MILPLPFLALLSIMNGIGIIPKLPNLLLIISYIIYILVCYTHMAYYVINILCEVLKIKAFEIKDIRLEQHEQK